MEAHSHIDPTTILKRTAVLAACRDEPRARQELVEETTLSRSTAYRVTVDLADHGLLERTGRGYQTTAYGLALLGAGETYRDAVDTVGRLEPMFDVIDHPALLEHAHLFAGAQVTVADATNPYRVANRAVERLENASSSRGTITSATAKGAMDSAASLLAETSSFERIFTASAIETHETVADGEFHDIVDSDSVSVLVAPDDEVPFSFAIDDVGVTIVGHDATTGIPTVHVESDNPGARAWLESIYHHCRTAAQPV